MLFKKIINMPTFLNEAFIENWIRNFLYMIVNYNLDEYKVNNLFEHFLQNEVTLIFSDEEPIANYGHGIPNLTSLKRELIEKLKITDKWCLERIGIAEDIADLHDAESCLAECACKGLGISYEECLDLVRELLNYSDEPSIAYVAGTFYAFLPYVNQSITLYNKVIQMKGKGAVSIPYYESVFIHELFHAYHCHIALCTNMTNELFNREDYTSTIVKESLASYFEYSYCCEFDIPTNLHKVWNTNILYSPYSGAKNIDSLDNKFCLILDESFNDVDSALRILLPSYDFYDVKNSITYVTKQVQIPVTNTPVYSNNKNSINGNCYAITHGVPIYLNPNDEKEFYEKLMKTHRFAIYMYYNDGTFDTHICRSYKIKSINNIRTNITSQGIFKSNRKIINAVYAVAFAN